MHDWKKLYAANRAAIEKGLYGGGLHLPDHTRRGRARAPATRRRGLDPGGHGTWERRTQDGRPYVVYTPPGVTARSPVPLIVMLHGCTQSVTELATATRMNLAADERGWVVAYPQQTAQHNHQSCWNWFLAGHQSRGAGEAGLIAGIASAMVSDGAQHQIDPTRVFVAGLSAGGAMAAVLAATYPDLFRAVAVHSGLPFRAATTTEAAFQAMARGAPQDGAGAGRALHEAMGTHARVVPAFVAHGTSDSVVSAANGDRTVAQWLAAQHLADPDGVSADPKEPHTVVAGRVEDGRSFRRLRWDDRAGRPILEYLSVEGMGHAWSGGAAGARYADPKGPYATQDMCDFFTAVAGD